MDVWGKNKEHSKFMEPSQILYLHYIYSAHCLIHCERTSHFCSLSFILPKHERVRSTVPIIWKLPKKERFYRINLSAKLMKLQFLIGHCNREVVSLSLPGFLQYNSSGKFPCNWILKLEKSFIEAFACIRKQKITANTPMSLKKGITLKGWNWFDDEAMELGWPFIALKIYIYIRKHLRARFAVSFAQTNSSS